MSFFFDYIKQAFRYKRKRHKQEEEIKHLGCPLFFGNFNFFAYTVKVDRERTVPMYIPGIYQNDRDENLNQKKFTLTVTRQERNFHCKKLK